MHSLSSRMSFRRIWNCILVVVVTVVVAVVVSAKLQCSLVGRRPVFATSAPSVRNRIQPTCCASFATQQVISSARKAGNAKSSKQTVHNGYGPLDRLTAMNNAKVTQPSDCVYLSGGCSQTQNEMTTRLMSSGADLLNSD